MRHPRLRADYEPVPLPGDDGAFLLLVGETRTLLVDDEAVAAVATLLDGTRDLPALAEAVAPTHSIVDVVRALRRLQGLNVLAVPPTPRPTTALGPRTPPTVPAPRSPVEPGRSHERDNILVSGRSDQTGVAFMRGVDAEPGVGVELGGGAVGVPRAVAAAWDARGVDPDAAAAWERQGRVLLIGATTAGASFGAADPTCTTATGRTAVAAGDSLVERVGALLSGPAVEVVDLADGPAAVAAAPEVPVVAVVASPVDEGLAAVNEACLASGRSWTLMRPVGDVLLVGPHLVPGETGCWQCLRQRWDDNEQVQSFLRYRLPGRAPLVVARSATPATLAVAAGLLAAELPVLALTGRSERITGRMLAFDTRDHTAQTHELVRQPQCPACGDPDLMRKAPPRVDLTADTGETTTADGGWRTTDPAATRERLTRHVSRYLGVVSRLAPLRPHDDGLTFSYGAGHNFALARTPAVLRKNLRGQSGGKGTTETQAAVSALGEAIERYSAVWRDDRPVHRASHAQLGDDRAVHLADLLLFSEDQYRRRDELNPRLSHFHRVPVPMDPDRPMDWTTAWSLTHDEPREVPAAYCWYGHPDSTDLGFCGADSNGCAAGNTMAEAVLQGFCELVERDQVALWWYHRSTLPGLDLDSVDVPWVRSLRRHYADRLGRDLWVLDLTADLGIPTFAGVSPRRDGPTQDVLVGFGAHPDPTVAVLRALTEVNQFLPSVSRRDDTGATRYGIADRDSVDWFTTVRVEDEPWLRPDPTVTPSTVAGYPVPDPTDLADAVRHCVGLADRAGLEVLAVRQTRPDLDLEVVRVIVPGLRHFWRRLGPGRLWRVPPRLGRTPLAAGEDDVNPRSVFF